MAQKKSTKKSKHQPSASNCIFNYVKTVRENFNTLEDDCVPDEEWLKKSAHEKEMYGKKSTVERRKKLAERYIEQLDLFMKSVAFSTSDLDIQITHLLYDDQMTIKQISQFLNMKDSAVRMRKSRITAKAFKLLFSADYPPTTLVYLTNARHLETAILKLNGILMSVRLQDVVNPNFYLMIRKKALVGEATTYSEISPTSYYNALYSIYLHLNAMLEFSLNDISNDSFAYIFHNLEEKKGESVEACVISHMIANIESLYGLSRDEFEQYIKENINTPLKR